MKNQSRKQKPTAKRARPAQGGVTEHRIPTSMWLLNLALAALFLGFLYYLKEVPQTTLAPVPSPVREVPVESRSTAQPVAGQEETRFKYDYEKLLPQAKVIPPNVKEYEPKEDVTKYEYRLQTGSFRRREDAEKQKAAIAFQGLRAEIREIRNSDSDIWYRVEIGPITSRSRMNKAVDKLVRISIQPIVRKQKIGH